MDTQHHLKGFLCVLSAICIWSGWVVVSRYGVNRGALSPYDITAIRFTTSGLLLLPVVWRKGLRIGPWGIWSGLLLSVLIGACYTNIVVAGMMFAPVSHASTVNSGTFLIITTLIGIHGLREHVSRLRLVGVMCSLAGIAFMLLAKSSGSPYQWIGHLCFIMGGIMWAGYALLARAWKVEASHAAAVVCVFSMITYMPVYLLFIQSHIGLADWHEVTFQSLYQGAINGVAALIFFNTGIGILGAARAGSLIPLIPAISTLLAVPFLGEIPSISEAVGIVAVSVGVFLSSGAISWRGQSKAGPKPLPILQEMNADKVA